MTESRKQCTQQMDNTKKNALKLPIAQICAGKNATEFAF